jgi:hypothetical protein
MSERTTRGPDLARRLLAAALAIAGCRDGGGGSGDDDGGDTGDSGTVDDGDDGDTSAEDDADTTADDGSTGETDTDGPGTDAIPPPGGLRRVLAHQYVGTIDVMFGPEVAAAALPPPDPSLGGFDSIAALESSLSPSDVMQYEESAKAVAQAVLAHPDKLALLVPCIAGEAPTVNCYTELATQLGRLAWRRPLTDEEIAPLAGVAVEAMEWDDGNFMTGVEYMVVALLQSPRFLYIVEVGTESADGPRELTQYELATRMAFFLLGRGPDVTLLDRAESGLLSTPEQIEQIANDLLGSPLARDTVNRFYGEFLTIRDLPLKGKDPELFPGFGEPLANAMIEETYRLVEEIVFERDTNVLDLYDSPTTFVNDDLAALYGINGPGPGEWVETPLPSEQHRAGVFTHASWLAMLSHGELNSPSRRGLFLQEQVLCNEIPPVPPDVNPMLMPPPEGMSLREWLETMHAQSGGSCLGCHAQFDPMGFAFEHYDPIGAYRTLDNGVTIDASGSVGGFGEWNNAEELVLLVRDDVRASGCLVKQVWVSALGFSDTTDQIGALMDLDETFVASEFNMKRLLVELTASDVFRHVEEPK